MNFIQACGAITNAKDHRSLLEAMQTARAPAHWSRYTADEQQELCNLAIAHSRKLAKQMRATIAEGEKVVEDAAGRMANPQISFL